jgi:hypothetical protein
MEDISLLLKSDFMKYFKEIMFIGFIICILEMIMSHNMIKSQHAWDFISLIMNFLFYLIIFIFSYMLLLFTLRFYKKNVLIYFVHFLPYVLISLYYVFMAMPKYVSYDIINLLFFPILISVLTFFYSKKKRMNKKENI